MIEVFVQVKAGPWPGPGRCVIDGDAATLNLPGMHRPERCPAGAVPQRLATLVGLGPRPVVAGPGMLITSASFLDRLLTAEDPPPTKIPSGWREVLSTLVVHRRAWWRITVHADAAHRGLEVIDAGDAGLWSCQQCPPEPADEIDAGEPVALTPTTATAVWAWLSPLAG